MSKTRSQKPEASPESSVPAPVVTAIRLTDYLTVKRPETAADLKLKEAVQVSLQRVTDMTMAFVEEKQAEGLSLEEILAFYELVSAIVPTVETHPDGRVKVVMDVQIVEREAGE